MVRHSRIGAYLLDFDGTLIDLPIPWEILRARLLIASHEAGVTPEEPSISGIFNSSGAELSLRLGIHETITRAELQAVQNSSLRPGAAAALEALARGEIPWAIVSNNSKVAIEACLHWHSLPFPQEIMGRTPTWMKPAAGPVEDLVRRMGLPRGSLPLVIGDRDSDRVFAKSLHFPFLKVAPASNLAVLMNSFLSGQDGGLLRGP